MQAKRQWDERAVRFKVQNAVREKDAEIERLRAALQTITELATEVSPRNTLAMENVARNALSSK